MAMSANLHRANRAEAHEAGTATWVSFHAKSDHVSIFVPHISVARAVAFAFNEAMAAKTEDAA